MRLAKKAIAAAACLSIAAGLLTACGEKQVDVNSEKPVLKQLGVYQKEDYNTYPVAAVLEEKTGYKVQYDMLPQDRWEEKLNLIMASGDSYDLITINGSGRQRYIDYAAQGALTDLTPLVEKYAPNVKAHVAQSTLDEALVNDKLYAIPNGSAVKIGDTVTNVALAVRMDLIEKAGIKLPKTLDEFTEFLRQIKAKDPGGNGSNNIPMVINNTANVEGILGAFGLENGFNKAEDGTIRYRVNTPAYQDYLKYMNQLYKEGLIDNEFPTNKSATTIEKFTSGRAMVMPMSWVDTPTVMGALTKNFPEARVEYLTPPVGENGLQGLGAGTGGAGFDRITFIPTNAKNPEHAMMYINAKLEPETFKAMTIGEEGVHYTMKDGAYYPILPKFFDERGSANNYMSGIDKDSYPDYWLARVRKDENMEKYFNILNTDFKQYHKMSPVFGAPISNESAKNLQAMDQLASDSSIKFIVGSNDFSQFDKFVSDWEAAGGEQYLKETNEFMSEKTK